MYNQYVLKPSCKIEFYVLGYTDLDEAASRHPVFLVSLKEECFGIFFAEEGTVYYRLLSKEEYEDYRYYCVKNHDKVQDRNPAFKVYGITGVESHVFMTVKSAVKLGILKTENPRTTFGLKLREVYDRCESYYRDGIDLYEDNIPEEIGDYFIYLNDEVLDINVGIKKVGAARYKGGFHPVYLFKAENKAYLVYYKSLNDGFLSVPLELSEDFLAAISDIKVLEKYFSDENDKIVCNTIGNSEQYTRYFSDISNLEHIPSETRLGLMIRLAISRAEDLYNEKKMMSIDI